VQRRRKRRQTSRHQREIQAFGACLRRHDDFCTSGWSCALPPHQAQRVVPGWAYLVETEPTSAGANLSEFVEETKASGLVKRALEHASVRGVEVAPLGGPIDDSRKAR
jgi:hypothetical protein